MGLLIGFLTFVLVLTCIVLVLLILIQLPKKEAGAGIAFGGSAADALFGAGSGNVLTKLTKYSGTTFIVLAIGLTLLGSIQRRQRANLLGPLLDRAPQTSSPAPTAQGTPTANPAPMQSEPIFQTNVVQGPATGTNGPATNLQAAPEAGGMFQSTPPPQP